MRISFSEVAEERKNIYDLYPVHLKGVYINPHKKYMNICIVTYCEYDSESMFVTEILIGKGSKTHSQYQIFEIPNDWIPVQLPEGVE